MAMDQVVLSAVNRTPVVQIVTLLCLVTSVLAFVSHACIKIYTSRAVSLEIVFVLVSLGFGVGQSIAVLTQAVKGYGKPIDTLHSDQIQAILKASLATLQPQYSSSLQSLSPKFAIVTFIHGLTPKRSDRYINYSIGAFTVLWLVSSAFVAVFQCHIPQTWDRTSDTCINRLAWWDEVIITHIISEVAILALEIAIMLPLHIPRRRKISITSLFVCRLFVAIAAAIQLHFFHEDNAGSLRRDITLGYWRSTICNQIVQCLGIVTTSLPYAKMFMESFESGLIRVDELRRKGEHSTDGSGRGYKLLDISRAGKQDGIERTKTFTVQSAPAS